MNVVDHGGLVVLDHDQCRRLLASREVGRVGLTAGGHPLILPVNYVLAGETIVFRTGPGTKLESGAGAPACFEVDEIDPASHAGWSVLAVGRLEEITDYDHPDVRRLRQLAVAPWAQGDRSHWMRLAIRRLTGRQVGMAPAAVHSTHITGGRP